MPPGHPQQHPTVLACCCCHCWRCPAGGCWRPRPAAGRLLVLLLQAHGSSGHPLPPGGLHRMHQKTLPSAQCSSGQRRRLEAPARHPCQGHPLSLPAPQQLRLLLLARPPQPLLLLLWVGCRKRSPQQHPGCPAAGSAQLTPTPGCIPLQHLGPGPLPPPAAASLPPAAPGAPSCAAQPAAAGAAAGRGGGGAVAAASPAGCPALHCR